jgi:DNA repair protein RecO (recombination protein O)
MPLYTADALILRTYKLGEADRIVVFLTRDRGKKRGVAKGARRQRSRFAGALEPLTQVSVAYFEKENRELVGLNYAETPRSPLLARHPEALGYVGYFAELLDLWAQDADPNERLYRLGSSVVEALIGGAAPDRLSRYFEYWLLRLQGVYPSITACQRCAAALDGSAMLAPQEHTFVCPGCAPAGGTVLSPDALTFLRGASRVPPAGVETVRWTPQAGQQLEHVHRLLMRDQLDRHPKSAQVLRDMRRGGDGAV